MEWNLCKLCVHFSIKCLKTNAYFGGIEVKKHCQHIQVVNLINYLNKNKNMFSNIAIYTSSSTEHFKKINAFYILMFINGHIKFVSILTVVVIDV